MTLGAKGVDSESYKMNNIDCSPLVVGVARWLNGTGFQPIVDGFWEGLKEG